MKLSDAFPSNFLAASEMNDEFTAPMSHIQEEDIGPNKDKKFVLYFKGMKKGLVLNVTNWKTIEKAFGDSDAWAGHRITLYPTETNFKGEMVQAIRVKIPKKPPAVSKTAPPEDWDAPWDKPSAPKAAPIEAGSQEATLLTEGEAMARQGIAKFRTWRDSLSSQEHTVIKTHLQDLTVIANRKEAAGG